MISGSGRPSAVNGALGVVLKLGSMLDIGLVGHAWPSAAGRSTTALSLRPLGFLPFSFGLPAINRPLEDDRRGSLNGHCCSEDTGHDDSPMVNRNILDLDEFSCGT
jgi:hypothetical protein